VPLSPACVPFADFPKTLALPPHEGAYEVLALPLSKDTFENAL